MSAKIKRHKKTNPHRHKPKGVSARQFEKVYWPYLPILLLILFLSAVGIQSGTLQAAIHHPSGNVLSYATGMSRSGLLADTNAARAANGVAALRSNGQLDAAAQAKANDMAARNYWSHYTPDGNPPWVFVTAQGYSYQKLGENLATGFNDEQSTINGWMASPPHRENLLDSAFSDVGFGYINIANYTAAGGGAQTLVVAFYGRPTPTAPIPVPTPAAPVTNSATPFPPVTPAPTPTASAPAPAQQPAKQEEPKEPTRPAAPTTQSLEPQSAQKKQGVSLAFKASRAELAFAQTPMASYAGGMVSFVLIAALVFWASRHLLALRRVFAKSEAYVIKHPLIDIGLLVIAALSYLLSQTAGLIQ